MDLHDKLKGNGRIQLTSDGFSSYIEAIERIFGLDIDFAQQIKIYGSDKSDPGKYSPPKVKGDYLKNNQWQSYF